MIGYTHIAVSLAVGRISGLLSPSSYVNIALISLFSVLPDVDFPKSNIGKLLKPISRYIYRKEGHRSFTHSFLFLTVGASILMLFSTRVSVLFSIGVGTHLLTDMLTYTGVRLLWPFHKNFTVLGGPILTGKGYEYVILFVSMLIFFSFGHFTDLLSI